MKYKTLPNEFWEEIHEASFKPFKAISLTLFLFYILLFIIGLIAHDVIISPDIIYNMYWNILPITIYGIILLLVLMKLKWLKKYYFQFHLLGIIVSVIVMNYGFALNNYSMQFIDIMPIIIFEFVTASYLAPSIRRIIGAVILLNFIYIVSFLIFNPIFLYSNRFWELAFALVTVSIFPVLAGIILMRFRVDTFLKRKELIIKNEQIVQSNIELETLNKQLTDMNHHVTNQNVELEILNEVLRMKNDEVENAKRRLSDRMLLTEKQNSELEELIKDLSEKNTIIEKSNFELANKNLEIYKQKEEISLALDQLSRAKSALNSFIQNSIDGIIIIDEEGKIAIINESAEKLVNTDKENLIGTYFWDFAYNYLHFIDNISKDSIEKWYCLLLTIGDRAFDSDNPFNNRQYIETIIKNPEGEHIYLQTSIFTVKTENGYMIGHFARDITHQKKADLALYDSEKKYRNIFESIQDLYFETNMEGIISVVSPSIKNIYGYSIEEVEGKHIISLYADPNDRIKLIETLKESLVINDYELAMKHKSGKIIDTSINAFLVIDETGKPIGIKGTARDLTDRKRTLLQLKESEEKFRSFFQNSSDCIIITDYDGRIVDVNPSFYKLSAYDLESINEKHIWDIEFFTHKEKDKLPWLYETIKLYYQYILHTGDMAYEFADVNDPFFNNKEDYFVLIKEYSKSFSFNEDYFEGEFINYNGEKKYIQGSTILFTTIKGYLIGSIIRDISSHKKAEKQIEEALERERELSNMKSRFISMVSHEYRTPMTVILSSTEFLEIIDRNEKPDKFDKYINNIKESISHMIELIEDVLFYSRLDSGREKIELIDEDIIDIIQQNIADISIIDKNLHKIYFNHSPEKIIFKTDKKFMRHILTNLLSNAIKYSPKNNDVNVSASLNDEGLCLIIKDNGIGIPEEDKKKLFEPFHRARNVGNIQGTGFGLSVVQKAITALDGSIDVDSQMNIGTKFTIKFPIIKNIIY